MVGVGGSAGGIGIVIGRLEVKICEGWGVRSCADVVIEASGLSNAGGMFSFILDSNSSSSSSRTASKPSARALRFMGDEYPPADSGLVGLDDSSPASSRSKIDVFWSKMYERGELGRLETVEAIVVEDCTDHRFFRG